MSRFIKVANKQALVPFLARLCFFSVIVAGIFFGVSKGLSTYSGYRANQLANEVLGQPYDSLRPYHLSLASPQPGTWLAEQFESGQSAAEFATDYGKGRKLKIAVQGLEPLSQNSAKLLATLKDYVGIFLCAEVSLLPVLPHSTIPPVGRRVRKPSAAIQYSSEYILDRVVPISKPKDIDVLILITDRDLYPRQDWNFVFGQAAPKTGGAVVSLARLDQRDGTAIAELQLLRRLLQTATHEASHTLGFSHCITHSCLMNGSMSLEEADKSPIHFCPICLKKLSLATQCEPIARFTGLKEFAADHGLMIEAEFFRQFLEVLSSSQATDSGAW